MQTPQPESTRPLLPALGAPPRQCTTGLHLRFRSLYRPGFGYSFPCDATGTVDIDRLGECARVNYFFARALVGRDFEPPYIVRTDR
jgi:hypothetical protein